MRYILGFADDATSSLHTVNTEEIQSLFAAWIYVFDPILGKIINAGLMRLREELTRILLPLPYDVEKGIYNMLGLLVTYEEDYEQHYCTKFPTPTNPAVYDEAIPNNTTNVARAKAKAVHTSKIADDPLFAAAKHETCNFIITVVDNEWVYKLRELIMFYTAVAPSELLEHLQK